MKQELQENLIANYPELFDGTFQYFQCEDGWFNILDTAFHNTLHYLSDNHGLTVTITQVKEKLGGLRIYYLGGDDYIRGLFTMAEQMSYHICEFSGNKGQLSNINGIIKTTTSQHKYLLRDPDVDKRKKGAVALDFDGVINSYKSNFVAVDNIPDPPVPGAFDAIREYLEYGLKVYIYSTRNEWDEGRQAIYDWLLEHGLEQETVDKIHIASGKPIAKLYVDDRAWHFSGKFPTVNEIKYYKPWHGGSSSSQK